MPTTKVTAAGLSGAIATVLIWAAGLAGVDMPPEVAAAVTTVAAAVLAYMVPERRPIDTNE